MSSSSSHHSRRSFEDTSALLPIDERRVRVLGTPSPRGAQVRGRRTGREPDVAGGGAPGRERGVEPRTGDGDPETVGADEPGTVRTDEREQSILPFDPLAAELCEPGRDDDERIGRRFAAHPQLRRTRARRHRDHRQVDAVPDLADRAVAANTRDGLALAIDRVDDAAEVALEDVAKELAADRAPARRCADDSHAHRLEERAQRRRTPM